MKLDPETIQTGSTSYAPEDNKLRLYVGRVPRPEFDALRAEGWTCTPKQSCDFVATWTPERRDTALAYGNGVIEDEDQPMVERAADRAERFGGYRDKRTDEATGHADRYDAGPQAHGYQNQQRAERAAARHDRIADRSCDAWSKAEYWQRRTAGVISNALYKSRPDVRMGRIKVLEAEQRKQEKWIADRRERWEMWRDFAAMPACEAQSKLVNIAAGYVHADFIHPRTGKDQSLWTMLERNEENERITAAEACALYLDKFSEPAEDNDWITHYKLRIAYENQMLEAQGGRAAHIEMEVGGWIGSHQIRKVNKSPATGRVVSVSVLAPTNANYDRKGKPFGADNPRPLTLHTIETERLSADVYRPPTEDERQAFATKVAGEKKAAKKAKDANPCPLINPTDEDAEKLQAIWNKANANKPGTVIRLTMEQFKARNGYSTKAVIICERGTEHRTKYGQNITRKDVFKVRQSDNGEFYGADRVVIITDKPQNPLPWDRLAAALAECPSIERITPRLPDIAKELTAAWASDFKDEKLMSDAEYLGLIFISSASQYGWTEAGMKLWKANQPEQVTA